LGKLTIMKNYLLLTFLCVNSFNLKAIDF